MQYPSPGGPQGMTAGTGVYPGGTSTPGAGLTQWNPLTAQAAMKPGPLSPHHMDAPSEYHSLLCSIWVMIKMMRTHLVKCSYPHYKKNIKSRSTASALISVYAPDYRHTDKHLRLVMIPNALCFTRQSRAPNVDRCAPEM